MEKDITNLKQLLADLKDVQYNSEYIKSLEACIKRLEETLCLDTIDMN